MDSSTPICCSNVIEWQKHCLFDLPVFQCPAFEDYLNLIKIHQNVMLDPSDVTLEQILSGVCNQFSNLHSDMSSHFTQIHESVSGLVKPADLQGFLNHVSGYNFNSLSKATENAAAASTPTIGSNAPVSQYELYKSHRTATFVSNEWFGMHHFDAYNNAKCFPGGIDELEISTKINGRIIFPLHRQNPSLESN